MILVYFDDYFELTTKKGITYKIDKEYDYLFLGKMEWHTGYYNYLTIYINNSPVRFHKLISPDCPKGLVVDHINRDRTDNRKSNLRYVTTKENVRNSGPKTGKYKGVSWSSHTKKWRATCKLDGKQKHLGYYKTEEEAALAYNNYIESLDDRCIMFRNDLSVSLP